MPKGISLHLGLNTVDPAHYAGWSGPLNACEADAKDMHKLAVNCGFEATTLLTAAATRKALLDRLAAAAATLKSGDIFFLTNSCHGGQVPDTNKDETDKFDETWCLYDAELLDDELYKAFSAFAAGVRILMLSDSCHSGTVAKEAFFFGTGLRPAVSRAMPRDIALMTFLQNEDFYTDLQKDTPKETKVKVKASVLLLSGCQDNQESSDGLRNGLFTATLLAVWKNGAFKQGYKAFHKKIGSYMPPVQSPNYYFVGEPNPAFEKQIPFKI